MGPKWKEKIKEWLAIMSTCFSHEYFHKQGKESKWFEVFILSDFELKVYLQILSIIRLLRL